ncbi:MAG: ABC transporter permease [Burkholderiales bacterium]|nr:ABC transporter permease [Burkholderiales bacterium]
MQFGKESSLRQLSRLAWRNVRRHRSRSAMTILAIVAGVSSLMLAGGFVEDLFRQLGESLIHSQSGHLQIGRAGSFTHGSRSPEKYLIEDVDELRGRLAERNEVDDAMARVRFSALLGNGKAELAVVAEGIEPEREAGLGTHIRIESGQVLTGADHDGILLGHGVARAMKLAPGDRVNLLVSTAGGALNTLDFRVVGTFKTFSNEFDARAVRIGLPAAQELLGTAGASALVILLHRTADTSPVASLFESAARGKGLEVKTWIELNDFYEKTVALYRRQLGVLELIILVMVALGVVNLVNMTVLERVGEFGTMRALGNGNVDVFMLVMIENALLAAFGALLGLVAGGALAWAVSAIGIPMPPPPNSDLGYTARILLTPPVLLKGFSVGFVATVLAALPPAWRVARMPIAEQLRRAI